MKAVSHFEKDSFVEILHSLEEIRKTSGKSLTKEVIEASFQGLELSKQQQDLIYEYLQMPQKEAFDGGTIGFTAEKETDEQQKLPDTDFMKLYLEDLKKIPRLVQQEEKRLYHQLIAGDKTAMQKLSEQWIFKVTELAKAKVQAVGKKEVADLIQEGNMGVFLALQQMLGSGKEADFEMELAKAAKDAMDDYVRKRKADADMDQSLLAKAALVYEAQKYLAEQLQRLPSAAELSQYTKIAEEELKDLLSMLEEKK